MKHISRPKLFVAVATVAILAVATSGQQGQQTIEVRVTNNTTTPAQGADHPQGHLQTECGMGVWNSVPASSSDVQRFNCYPGNLTYKARLADAANGDAVYHSGTVAINCSQSSSSQSSGQPAPVATSATFTLTGSGTGITASNVSCGYQTASFRPSWCRPWMFDWMCRRSWLGW